MKNQVPYSQPRSAQARPPQVSAAVRVALNEHEVAARWLLSVKTLRRWRQEQLGPVFCKFGSRVVYLLAEIEAYERKVARYSTAVKVSP